MTAYTERMPVGFPGDPSRRGSLTIEPRLIGVTAPAAPGLAVIGDGTTGAVIPPTSTATPLGFLTRTFPAQDWSQDQDGAPRAGDMADVMRRGYMTVKCYEGTPTPDGVVYIRYANDDADHPLGGVEAASVADTTMAINATFMGEADADGNVEIAFNI